MYTLLCNLPSKVNSSNTPTLFLVHNHNLNLFEYILQLNYRQVSIIVIHIKSAIFNFEQSIIYKLKN